MDAGTHEVICADRSLNNVTDAEAFPRLIHQTHRKIRVASADGAYDTRRCHDELRRKKIKALHDGFIFIKATLDGIKIGHAALTYNDAKKIKLADIIIDEGYINLGVGSIILIESIESVASLGVMKIYGVMCGDTNKSTKFYKSFEFEIHDNIIKRNL